MFIFIRNHYLNYKIISLLFLSDSERVFLYSEQNYYSKISDLDHKVLSFMFYKKLDSKKKF